MIAGVESHIYLVSEKRFFRGPCFIVSAHSRPFTSHKILFADKDHDGGDAGCQLNRLSLLAVV